MKLSLFLNYTIIIVLFNLSNAIAQKYVNQRTVVPILESQSIYLNSGSRIGGKQRTFFQVNLPKNTIEWYYSFTTYPNESNRPSLSLMPQLTKLVDPTGLLGIGVSSLTAPTGANVIDVYITDLDWANKFLEPGSISNYAIQKPQYYIEASRENFKSGVVQVKNLLRSSTYYICLRNPSSTDGINITIDCAAIVEQKIYVDEWTDDGLTLLSNDIKNKIGKSGDSTDIIVNCCQEKWKMNYKPSDYNNSNLKGIKNNLFVDECINELGFTNYLKSIKRKDQIQSEISKYTVLKDYYRLLTLHEELVALGYTDFLTLNNAAWYAILNKEFDKASNYVAQCLGKYPNYIIAQGNLAHIFIMTGRYEDAKEIYLKFKKERINRELTWKEMVKADYETFKKNNLYTPQMDEIKKLLNIK